MIAAMKGDAENVGRSYGPISRTYVARFADPMPTCLRRRAMECFMERSKELVAILNVEEREVGVT